MGSAGVSAEEMYRYEIIIYKKDLERALQLK
jgi:hypothetical protein